MHQQCFSAIQNYSIPKEIEQRICFTGPHIYVLAWAPDSLKTALSKSPFTCKYYQQCDVIYDKNQFFGAFQYFKLSSLLGFHFKTLFHLVLKAICFCDYSQRPLCNSNLLFVVFRVKNHEQWKLINSARKCSNEQRKTHLAKNIIYVQQHITILYLYKETIFEQQIYVVLFQKL